MITHEVYCTEVYCVCCAAHGKYRVVTEKTLVAMPENVIGLLPDIGFAYFARQAPEAFGLYMALTGTSISITNDARMMLTNFHSLHEWRLCTFISQLSYKTLCRLIISLTPYVTPKP